jgi:hypothetical protein
VGDREPAVESWRITREAGPGNATAERDARPTAGAVVGQGDRLDLGRP